MKVLVTGGKGFVGNAIVSALSHGGIETVLLDMSPETGKIPNSKFVAADITDAAEIDGLVNIGEVDAIVHAAGLAHQFGAVSKDEFWQVNVEGTKNIARLAERLNARRFILISSVSVYGDGETGAGGRPEDVSCNPEGLYAQSKYESEQEAVKVCEHAGMALTILRLATVIGEGDRGNVFRLIKAVDQNKFYWIGRGENRKSLVYKEDVARACIAVLQNPKVSGGTYNVSAPPVTMKSIVEYIEQDLGKKVPGITIPAGLLNFIFGINSKTLGIGLISRHGKTVEKWLSDETFSAESIKADYGFEPEVSVEEAIGRETVWYLAHK